MRYPLSSLICFVTYAGCMSISILCILSRDVSPEAVPVGIVFFVLGCGMIWKFWKSL